MADTKSTAKKARFLKLLAETGNVSRSAIGAGIDRRGLYRERDTDAEFAAAWEEALESGVDELEEEARKRAKEGSDTLLIFLLKANRPQKYRDQVKVESDNKVILEVVYGSKTENQSA